MNNSIIQYTIASFWHEPPMHLEAAWWERMPSFQQQLENPSRPDLAKIVAVPRVPPLVGQDALPLMRLVSFE